MSLFDQNLETISKARKELEDASNQFYQAKLSIQKAKNPTTLSSIRNELDTAGNAYLQTKADLEAAIKALYDQHDYKQAAAEMNASVPVLMFPVRIETRFVPVTNDQLELWLRIYPDDIHIHSHERLLTDEELNSGKQYWLSLLSANRDNNTTSEDKKKDAWSKLYTGPGVQRALWIAKQTQPLNWLSGLNVADDQLQFPTNDETSTHVWTQAPRTQLLPDKFEVSIFRNDKPDPIYTQIGEAIPDTVFLGPDPFLAEDAFKKTGNKIELDESFAWITDFEKAVQQGLAMKIKIQNDFFNNGQIDRLVVMGLLSSATSAEGKEFLEQLIENHHYSKKGFSFLPQGSATNNTEASGSAYKKNEDYFPKGYYDGIPLNDFVLLKEAEGNNIASALGINVNIFNEVNNASIMESFEASAMNTALYPATIGNFIEVLLSPTVNKGDQINLRQFFTKYVTASGPLASIRVGDQPYGVLLTSNMNEWGKSETDLFYKGITGVFNKLQSKWNLITASKVANVNKGGDPSELMLEILGLEAGSVSFAQRLGHLPDYQYSIKNIAAGFGNEVVAKQMGIINLLKMFGVEEGEKQNPYMSCMNFYEHLNNIPYNKLVDEKAPSDDRFLEKSESNLNYIEWLAQVKKTDDLYNQKFSINTPSAILYLLLRHALLLELLVKTEEYYLESNVPFTRGAYEKSFINVSSQFKDLTTTEVLKGSPSAVDSHLKVTEGIGDYLLNLPEKHIDITNHVDNINLSAMRSAMNNLSKLPTARLHKHLTDHIDLCSYRLDAWQMGLFNRRIQNMRANQAEGIYIGAYGWIENLRVAPRELTQVPELLKPANQEPVYHLSSNAGFVQTPSLNHATAAGLLLAGYHNHATKSDPGSFAINLSSERVRRAMFVFEGIQNNQSLEALLGYQFERALHDATTANPATNNLNQYILSFREKYPINSSSIPQQGTEAQETVPAYSVVNGLKIVQAKNEEILQIITDSNHQQLILKEKNRLEDTLDALNDLMISETAYQATQGKMDRTAGLLNAMKNAELPPDLEFYKTPRSSHLSFTNRVSLHFNTQADQTAGANWPSELSPRAIMEKGLNNWLGEMIGNPSKIVATISALDNNGTVINTLPVTLADLNFQPIDLIYFIGTEIQSGAKELEYLIEEIYRNKIAVAADSSINIMFDPEVNASQERSLATVLPLIRLLRLLITTGKPASAKDFVSKAKTKNDQDASPPAWNIDDLKDRVTIALKLLTDELEKINQQAPDENPPEENGSPATLKDVFELYYAKGSAAEVLEKITLSNSTITSLKTFLQNATQYGVKITYHENLSSDPEKDNTEFLVACSILWKNINKKINLATQKLDQSNSETNPVKQINRLTEAVKAILGDDFVVFPLFNYSNPDEMLKVTTDGGDQLLKYINKVNNTTNELAVETWMQSTARVRPNMSRLEQVRMISEAQNESEFVFQAAQIPFRENNSWLAVEFSGINETTSERFDILDDTISFAIYGEQAKKVNEPQSVLLIDEWTESIPNEKEITGISFNYDQPNASAPNTVLLALEPTGSEHWNWDVLLGVLNDTLDRAKTRAVEPTHLMEDPALDTLLPMTVAKFDLNDANISLDYLVANDQFIKYISQHSYDLYKAWAVKTI